MMRKTIVRTVVRRAVEADCGQLARLLRDLQVHYGSYGRVDWTTGETNDGAQRFYDGLGVPRLGKVNYRLARADLEKLVSPRP